MSSPGPLPIYQQKLHNGVLDKDAGQLRAVQILQRLFAEITGPSRTKRWAFWGRKETPKGIYMYGGVGRGKSMLMDMFYQSLPDQERARRVHFHEFMIEVHDYLHTRRSEDSHSMGFDATLPMFAARLAERTDVLCFDEFHVTDVADAMILGRLFRALFERGVIVVATSNWPPDRLYEGGLQRDRFLPFIDFLKERLEIVHLAGETDYRAACLQGEATYFYPLNRATTRRMQDLFDQLTAGAVLEKKTLNIKGRTIEITKAAGGVAWLTFFYLCERPHGAEDYLEIAQHFDTIFLEGVPRIGYDRRNEAKRFMTLIDALYENHCKLIISADAPPDKLYFGRDHKFEFERTVSRLLEMGSAGYLAG